MGSVNKFPPMIGQSIRLYRARLQLTQEELAGVTLLNQKLISDLESNKPYAIKQMEADPDRFCRLRELIGREPITVFKSADFPELACEDKRWVAFVPDDLKSECTRLFAGEDVAIVIQA